MAKLKKLTIVDPKTSSLTEEAHAHDEINPSLVTLIRSLLVENEDLRKNYERLLTQAGRALLKTLEIRDPYTYGHSMRVMEYTLMIGKGARLMEADMKRLEFSAMFHDIGKIGVADCVLLKPARLDPQEQALMAEHPIKSAEVVDLIDEFRVASPGVKHHHERFDGEGYPLGLKGTDIPLDSRIILVADTFDAMTSTRPYRKALPLEVAYAELEKYSGVQFDPEFVKIFLKEHQQLLKFQGQPFPQKEKKAA